MFERHMPLLLGHASCSSPQLSGLQILENQVSPRVSVRSTHSYADIDVKRLHVSVCDNTLPTCVTLSSCSWHSLQATEILLMNRSETRSQPDLSVNTSLWGSHHPSFVGWGATYLPENERLGPTTLSVWELSGKPTGIVWETWVLKHLEAMSNLSMRTFQVLPFAASTMSKSKVPWNLVFYILSLNHIQNIISTAATASAPPHALDVVHIRSTVIV